MMEEIVHSLGLQWNDRKPYLVYREDLNSLDENKVYLTTDNTFSITIDDIKKCIGYYDSSLKESFLCPYQKSIRKEYYQCFHCGKHEKTYMYGLKSLDETQTEILRNKDHINYLNLFGKDLIKVGVSTERRKWSRVLEQGADATLFFAKSDGVVAREIESFVSKNFKIRQAITTTSKLKLLFEIFPEVEAQDILNNIFLGIKEKIGNTYKNYLETEAEFSYNFDYYNFDIPLNCKEVKYIDDIEFKDTFSGVIKGVLGQVILFEKDGELFALNSAKLKGFLIDFSNQENTSVIQNKAKVIKLKK